MACIPARNRNVFSYRASLPHTISVEILIGKANILTFHQETQEPRPASRNSIGKSRNSPFKRYELAVRRASDQRTITPRRIFTSGRMHATGYGAGEFTFSLAAHRVMQFFLFLPFLFSRRSRTTRARGPTICLYWSVKNRQSYMRMTNTCDWSTKFQINRRWNPDEVRVRKTDILYNYIIKMRGPVFYSYGWWQAL